MREFQYGASKVEQGFLHPQDPLKDPKNETPKYEPLITSGKLGDYWGFHLLDPLRGLGLLSHSGLRPAGAIITYQGLTGCDRILRKSVEFSSNISSRGVLKMVETTIS